MGISRATYYRESFKEKEQIKSDLELKNLVEKIHLEFPGYGYRRIREHLLRQNVTVNAKRIRRVMKIYSIFSSRTHRNKPRGSHSDICLRHPNLIRGLKINAPDQVWATDITFIKLLREEIYLSAVIDVYTRVVVGWAISRSLKHEFCLDSMRVAIAKRKPKPGIIHHSDRGVQYVCENYMKFLETHGFKASMSKVATPQDNAFIESFFKTLKHEEVFARNYETMSDVIRNLPKFIDEVYNKKRLHSSLGYKTPEEFESEVMKLKPTSRPVQKIWGRAV